MARNDQRQGVGKHLGEPLVRLRGDPLLAGVGRGGDPDLPARGEAGELGELAPVGRQRRRVVFDVAGDHDARRAERAKPLAVRLAAGKAQVEPGEQRADGARRPPPAVERALADPSVDHCERQAGALGLDDHVRPQLQLGDQRRVRAPVEQEAAQEERIVERGVLVQRPRRQAPGEQRRGRHRAGRHQRGRAGARDALDERQQRDGFADARPVQPDEPAQRAGKACAAAPLADPLAVLLAAPEAQRQERDGERRPDRGQRPVDMQRERRGHAVLRFAPGSVAPTIA